MSIEDDGGPAFPGMQDVGSSGDYMTVYNNGMTLRDYFAARAMQGELAAQDVRNDGKGTGVLTPDTMLPFATRCYAMADAMLEARKK